MGKPKPNQPNKKKIPNCSKKKKTRDQLSALAELIIKLQKNRPELWHFIF